MRARLWLFPMKHMWPGLRASSMLRSCLGEPRDTGFKSRVSFQVSHSCRRSSKQHTLRSPRRHPRETMKSPEGEEWAFGRYCGSSFHACLGSLHPDWESESTIDDGDRGAGGRVPHPRQCIWVAKPRSKRSHDFKQSLRCSYYTELNTLITPLCVSWFQLLT